MTKVEKIVFESLMSRGYSESEAGHFITVLKCPNDKTVTKDITERIDVIFKKYITKISENEKLNIEINRLRSENLDLIKNLLDTESVLETTIKNNNVLKRTINLMLNNFQKEIQNAKKIINDKGVFEI